MIIFILIILLIVWCVTLLSAEKAHNIKYCDHFYKENEKIKFSDTINLHRYHKDHEHVKIKRK